MEKRYFFIIFILFSIQIFGQTKIKGDKNVILQDRIPDYFNKIIVKNDVEVTLINGNDGKITVEADENLQDVIITKSYAETLEIYLAEPISYSKKLMVHIQVNDSTLTIETRDKAKVMSNSELKIKALEIVALDKSKIKISSKTNTTGIVAKKNTSLELMLTANHFTNVSCDENANVKMSLTTDILNVNLLNTAFFKPTGNCKSIKIEASGNSNFSGKEMLAEEIIINAVDKTDVAVNASKNLDISAQNDSEIYIYDNPQIQITKFTDKAILFKKQ